MRHVFWLRESVLAGRSGPSHDAWSLAELASAGIGAILSVNDGELVHCEDMSFFGMEYACVPLSDAAPPQPGDLKHCVEALPKALRFVLDAIQRDRTVLVHCRSGKDRTGMLMSYYLCATEAMTPTDAIRVVRSVRPIALSADGWESLTLNVLHALDA